MSSLRDEKPDNKPLYALAASIFASALAMAGAWYSANTAFDAQMVQIGVGILSADPTKTDVSPAREWAIELVEKHSGVKFSSKTRDDLLRHPIRTIVIGNSPMGLAAAGCDAFRKNADGSWTQTGTIIVPGNNQFTGTTFRGTAEAKILDQICK